MLQLTASMSQLGYILPRMSCFTQASGGFNEIQSRYARNLGCSLHERPVHKRNHWSKGATPQNTIVCLIKIFGPCQNFGLTTPLLVLFIHEECSPWKLSKNKQGFIERV